MPSEKYRFIKHQGKNILFLDFSGTPQELIKTLEGAARLIEMQPHHTLLILTDVREGVYSSETSRAIKEFTLHNTPYVNASAVVGVTGLKRVLLSAIVKVTGRHFELFEHQEDALNWLVNHA